MLFSCQAYISYGQHHEYKGLQRNDQQVKNRPAEMQRQLPDTDYRDQDKNNLASKQDAYT